MEMPSWKSYDTNVYYEMQTKIDMQKLKPFFIVGHYPYTVSLLLKINTNYKADVFHKAGLQGSSKDWERLSAILMDDYYMENSGIDLFEFDSDDDIFCIFSEYIDAVFRFALRYLLLVCNDDDSMIKYLTSTA